MPCRRKSGQATGASVLIAIIGGLIVLYLMFIEPSYREQLLNGGTGTPGPGETQVPGDGGKIERVLLEVSPGRIDYLKFTEYDHPLPPFSLYDKTIPNTYEISNSVYIKNGLFDKQDSEKEFTLSEIENIKNVILSFNLDQNRNNKGRLIISLNDKEIFDKEIGSSFSSPISISTEDLKTTNTIKFEVSGVGWQFWTTNEYELNDVTLVFDKVDLSNTKGKSSITITTTEMLNMEEASMTFVPNCNSRDNGVLEVKINSKTVYEQTPQCGIPNIIDLPPETLMDGMNFVSFESESGRYTIDSINIKTEMRQLSYPTYHFDLDERLFYRTKSEDDEEECGEIDGECPNGCDPDLDRDCCFESYGNYWCDIETSNPDFRCSPVTEDYECSRCRSGYEDRNGYSPELCEDNCGDDKDGDCPPGCSMQYDRDCCFSDAETNFWCDDAPKYGLRQCKPTLTQDECEACASGWESEESNFECEEKYEDYESELKDKYRIKMTLEFFDDRQVKSGTVFVNGHRFSFDRSGNEYVRFLDSYVRDGINSIKIVPESHSFEITNMVVEIVD